MLGDGGCVGAEPGRTTLGMFQIGRLHCQMCMLKFSSSVMHPDFMELHKKSMESIEVDHPYEEVNVSAACHKASMLTTQAICLLCPAQNQSASAHQSHAPEYPGVDISNSEALTADNAPAPCAHPRHYDVEAKSPERAKERKVKEYCRRLISESPDSTLTKNDMKRAFESEYPDDDCVHVFKKMKMGDLFTMGRKDAQRNEKIV